MKSVRIRPYRYRLAVCIGGIHRNRLILLVGGIVLGKNSTGRRAQPLVGTLQVCDRADVVGHFVVRAAVQGQIFRNRQTSSLAIDGCTGSFRYRHLVYFIASGYGCADILDLTIDSVPHGFGC